MTSGSKANHLHKISYLLFQGEQRSILSVQATLCNGLQTPKHDVQEQEGHWASLGSQDYHYEEVQVGKKVWKVSNISICNNYLSILLHNLKSQSVTGGFLQSLQSLPLLKSHDLAKEFCQSRESLMLGLWESIQLTEGGFSEMMGYCSSCGANMRIWDHTSVNGKHTICAQECVKKQVLHPTRSTKAQQYTNI